MGVNVVKIPRVEVNILGKEGLIKCCQS